MEKTKEFISDIKEAEIKPPTYVGTVSFVTGLGADVLTGTAITKGLTSTTKGVKVISKAIKTIPTKIKARRIFQLNPKQKISPLGRVAEEFKYQPERGVSIIDITKSEVPESYLTGQRTLTGEFAGKPKPDRVLGYKQYLKAVPEKGGITFEGKYLPKETPILERGGKKITIGGVEVEGGIPKYKEGQLVGIERELGERQIIFPEAKPKVTATLLETGERVTIDPMRIKSVDGVGTYFKVKGKWVGQEGLDQFITTSRAGELFKRTVKPSKQKPIFFDKKPPKITQPQSKGLSTELISKQEFKDLPIIKTQPKIKIEDVLTIPKKQKTLMGTLKSEAKPLIKQIEKPKIKPKSKILPTVTPITKTGVTQEPTTKPIISQEPKILVKQPSIIKPVQPTKEKIKQKIIPSLVQSLKQTQIIKPVQAIKPVTVTKAVTKTITPTIKPTKIKTTKIIPIPKPKGAVKELRKKQLEKIKKQAYEALVKRKQTKKGKGSYISRGYIKASKEPLTKEAALGLAMKNVDKYTNRSFRIRKTKGVPKPRKDLEQTYKQLRGKFRTKKKNPNIKVEKVNFAIDSGAEKRGIPYEAIKVKRKKRMSLL